MFLYLEDYVPVFTVKNETYYKENWNLWVNLWSKILAFLLSLFGIWLYVAEVKNSLNLVKFIVLKFRI